jgi:uncharacterized membrane protein
VSTVIDAPREAVWAVVRDIASHPTWMKDAVAIRFTSPRQNGVGATFDCDTRVGPFAMTDRMEVTEWREGRVMGIHHVGLVQGTGRFTLHRARGGRTRFRWSERLRFPLWLGGPITGVVARPVLRRVWKGNLRRLKLRVEAALPRQ